jgi:hypothetical protein
MMNTFKKIETASLTLSAILCLCVALFVVGCGDSGTFAGTSEETNEMAENISSNSVDEESSSSFDVQEPHPESISSSAQKTSSSSRVVSSSSRVASSSSRAVSSSSRVASSSSRTLSSSSARISSSSQEHSSSSSKQKDNTNTSKYSSSSFDGDTHTPPIHEQDPNSNSLDSYLKLFKLDSGSFDGGVLSATFDVSESVIPGDPVDNPPTASATEFDGPWPHKFVKQNIVALGHFFPNAEKEYSDIVNAIKNDTLDANCGLYMLNVYGDGKAAGFVLANIVKDTITVLDISAGRCEPSSGRMERFLFYYCGEIDSRPEIVHILVENNLSAGCPVLKNEEEWVKDKSQTP